MLYWCARVDCFVFAELCLALSNASSNLRFPLQFPSLPVAVRWALLCHAVAPFKNFTFIRNHHLPAAVAVHPTEFVDHALERDTVPSKTTLGLLKCFMADNQCFIAVSRRQSQSHTHAHHLRAKGKTRPVAVN